MSTYESTSTSSNSFSASLKVVGYCNGVVFNSVIVMERDSLIVVVQFLLQQQESSFSCGQGQWLCLLVIGQLVSVR